MSKIEKKPIKLTRAEKQNIASAVQRANNKPKGVKSAQDSIPYRHIFPDGICHVGDKLYTKTLQFGDINYQIAQNEDKTAIFESWCDFLNYFDSTIKFQHTFLNTTANTKDFEQSVFIATQADDFDGTRTE